MGFLATPIGWLMRAIYGLVKNYFVTILLITLIMRILLFPFSLKSQKSTADRARLAPRLERLQKKYGQDKQKMAQKQQELYQKEGVSMMGGCLPTLLQMVVLFSMLAVIYYPLQYLTEIPENAITYAVEAVKLENYTDENGLFYDQKDSVDQSVLVSKNKLGGYYKELNMLQAADKNKERIINYMTASAEGKTAYTAEEAVAYYDEMMTIRNSFSIGKYSLLQIPWGNGFSDISLLWLIPLLSGVTAFAMSFLSMHYMKGSMGDQNMPGAGCTNGMMMYGMPAFSLIIAFTVPGGVGMYWIFSNIIGIGQTVLLNKIYNPAQIRKQAEIEYEERRRQRAEDKKRLAEEHAREQAELDRERKAQAAAGKKKPTPAGPKPEDTPPDRDPDEEPDESGAQDEERDEQP